MGIVVQNLCKRFGAFVAVDNVSFEVQAGELVALLGPSGSGKSTILRIIAGLERPDSGEIYLTGKDVTSLSTQKRKIGFVFQHYALFKHMTVEKNIAFGMEVQKHKKEYIKEKIEELVNLVRLQGYEKHYPDQLSGGQRQRVALARALAVEPKVLLLDEPFGALDAKVRDNLAQWLQEFHKKLNITSIFVTHDQNEAIKISDRIVVINRGRVEQVGAAKEVYEHPRSKFVASFIGQVNLLDAVVKKNQIFIKDTDYIIDNNPLTLPLNKGGQGGCKKGENNDLLNEGDVVLLIRPENIELNGEPKSQRDLPCLITRIHYQGSHYKIDCAINGMSVTVIENKHNIPQGQWHENQRVFLSFRSFRIFRAEEGHERIHEKLKELGYIE